MKRIFKILLAVTILISSILEKNVLVSAKESVVSEKTVVALDPGHDTRHAGATASNLLEHELTLKIAYYCKEELEKYRDIEVYMTRSDNTCPYSYTGNSARCIEQRMLSAENAGASLYVSFHLNAEENGTSANGVEVIYPNSNWKPQVGARGQILAQNIQTELVGLGLYNRGIYYKNSTINERYADNSLADYYTVQISGKKSGIPGVIVEHAFITNETDRNNFLQTEEGLKKLGVANANAIARTLGKQVGWVYIEGGWYYYLGGEKATGWVYIDGIYYFMNNDGIMQTGWQYIDGKWYYLDASGVMQTGWENLGGYWYYFANSGAMQTGWQYLGDCWYYMDASGVMQTGWQYLGGCWYYMNTSGVMQTGWQYLGDCWYYMDASGVMQIGWETIGGVKYLFDASGKMVNGAQAFVIDVSRWQGKVDWDKVATTEVDGVIVRCGHGDELTEKNGKWQDVKFEENIAALNRLGIPYGIYHYNTATTVEQARTQAKNAIALIRSSNANPTLPVFVDIEQDAGACDLVAIAQVYMEEIIANGYKPGIYANANYWDNYLNAPMLNAYYKWIACYGLNNGSVSSTFVPKDGFENYMMWQYTSQGKMEGITENTVDCNVLFSWNEKTSGWKLIDNQWFYYSGGYLTHGWRIMDEHWYYFANSGTMQTGWIRLDGFWYYFDTSGVMQTGWLYLGGCWYYMDASGVMQTGWLYVNGYWYYLNESGAMVTGEQIIDGYTYQFNNGGVWID